MKVGIIPARYESTRLPGKPLADIGGKSLVQRVWEQTSKAKQLDRVIIATDDQRIENHAREIGAEVVLTGSEHQSGSDRIEEVARKLEIDHLEVVANIQGDVPFINPDIIDNCIAALTESNADIATVGTPITEIEEFHRDSVVKIVTSAENKALYFSRTPIPFNRAKDVERPLGLKHIGLYIYTPEALQRLTSLPPSSLEKTEGLEQLRALQDGMEIAVSIIDQTLIAPGIEVDTPEDLERARQWVEKGSY